MFLAVVLAKWALSNYGICIVLWIFKLVLLQKKVFALYSKLVKVEHVPKPMSTLKHWHWFDIACVLQKLDSVWSYSSVGPKRFKCENVIKRLKMILMIILIKTSLKSWPSKSCTVFKQHAVCWIWIALCFWYFQK